MSTEFRLPELGENITSGVVSKVLVAVGDVIETGQNVLEIETDKAVAEIPCSIAGTVTEVRAEEGAKLSVDDVVLLLDEEGGAEKGAKKKKVAEPAEKPDAGAESSQTDAATKKEAPPAVSKKFEADAVRAAPSVRRLAREHDVALHEVPSADPTGKISAQDVRAYLAARQDADSERAPDAAGSAEGDDLESRRDKWGEVVVEPMNAIRSKAATHLANCWNSIPHVTHFDKADITELEAFRKRHARAAEAVDARLTVTAFLIKALPEVFKRFPRVNASVDMEAQQFLLKHYYHIGVAVDTPHGLVVPVIRQVNTKTVVEIAVEMSTLADKARTRKLALEEMQGGTFTVSNLGGVGGHGFTPIINAPETAILGVSRAVMEPVYADGEFEARLMLPLCLSYDHRCIDGAEAARFLRYLAESLEQPWRMMLGI